MGKELGLDSSFEDIYKNRKAFPQVYKRVQDLAQITEMPTAVETPRLFSLEEIVAKCVDRYIDLGFHTFIYPDITEEEAMEKYRKDFTIPKAAKKPTEYEGRFDVINIIDPRIPLFEEYERAGVKSSVDTRKTFKGAHFPDKPYVVFTHNGTLYFQLTVNQAKAKFATDEVGEFHSETTALYLNYPELFVTRGRVSAGSRTESSYFPYFEAYHGRPRVGGVRPGGPNRNRNVGSCGKEIIVLGSS